MKMKKEEVKEKMLTQSKIINEYDWTKTLIKKFLPKPKLVPNPHYRSAAPMQLWKEADVKEVMKTPEFKEAFAKAKKRKASASKAVDTKKDKLKEQKTKFLNSIHIKILSDKTLRKKALKAKREWYEQKEFESGYYMEPSEIPNVNNTDESTMQRWVVNYIRHNLVKYDNFLEKIHGKVGVHDCYVDTKVIILQKIAEAYPSYAEECRRQISRCEMFASMRENLSK